MTTHIPDHLRTLVQSRSGFRCEYCLMPESATFLGCQVDHIIAEKHSGATDAENLAYACVYCNRFKGSDVGSIDPGDRSFVRFFNPRIDNWTDHFQCDGVSILPITPIGRVTSRILRFNALDRTVEREAVSGDGTWPYSTK